MRTSETNGGVVTKYLHGHHSHSLTLGGVDLTGHDGGAGLVFGDDQLADTVTGARSVPAHVIGDLHQGVAKHTQGAGDQHQGVVGA